MQPVYFTKNLNYLTSNTIITQAQLAKMLNVSRQAVHNMLISNNDIRLSTVLKIADAYSIDAAELLFIDLEKKYKNKRIAYKITVNYNKKDEDA